MGFSSLVLAILYREFAFFKRLFSEYFVVWFIPLLFSLAVVFLPTTIFERSAVVSRISYILGVEMSFSEILLYSFAVSAIMSLTITIVNDVIQSLYHEKSTTGVLQLILETTSLRTYIASLSVVKPVLVTILSTLYLAVVLPLVGGFKGLILYAVLLPSLIISGIALGLYSMAIGIVLTFYTRISRPWTIPNTLTPALLAGSGLYIPIHLVPIVIRYIAYTAPIPQECEVIRVLATRGFVPELLLPITMITVLIAIYIAITSPLAHIADRGARHGG